MKSKSAAWKTGVDNPLEAEFLLGPAISRSGKRGMLLLPKRWGSGDDAWLKRQHGAEGARQVAQRARVPRFLFPA